MNYPGKELENFDLASIWRKYIYFLIKKYIKGSVLEVGAGIGSFTNNYSSLENNGITLTEIDNNNYKIIKERFKNRNYFFYQSVTKELKGKFNTIMYLNVLEHIEKDTVEINDALEKLDDNGYLIILVPAHNKLYSKFDEAVGHFKRYEIDYFNKLKLNNAVIEKTFFLDCMGYFLYYINGVFFKEDVYPSKLKILIWDKIFTPITFFLDKILNYKFGKNLLCVIKKTRS
tara:strand:- start:82 stop:771 length:690 start_codon:yes stop_codon:yes gene_type:complete